MNVKKMRLSSYLVRTALAVFAFATAMAFTPQKASAITLCSTKGGGCITFSGIYSCEWANANLPDVACFLSQAFAQSSANTLVRNQDGGATFTLNGKTGHVASDANNEKFLALMSKPGGTGPENAKEFFTIFNSPDKRVSETRLQQLAKETKMIITVRPVNDPPSKKEGNTAMQDVSTTRKK